MLKSKLTNIKYLFCLLIFSLTGSSIAQNIYMFSDPVYYNTDTGSSQTIARDVNGDTYPDLIVLNYANLSVLLNNGDGTFQDQAIYAFQSHSYALEAADFNNDNFPDIVVSCQDDNVISYLQNNGDGTFQYFINSPTQISPRGIDSYDFNGDGYLDIALVNHGSKTVQILQNNHDGTFTSSFSTSTGEGPYHIAIGDLDSDNKPEIVVTRSFVNYIFVSGVLTVYHNNGDGTFSQYIDNVFGSSANNIYISDFNGDSYNDIITNSLRQNTYQMCFFINDGQGNFGEPLGTFAGYSGQFTMADFDFNGHMDFAVAENQYNASGLSIVLNDGGFNFQPVWSFYVGDQPRFPASADLDRDGDIDIAVPLYNESKVAVVINTLDPVPVELTSFTARADNGNVVLNWRTATETNNKGFEIERSQKAKVKSQNQWEKIGFVEGRGTTTKENSYTYTDKDLESCKYSYKLVQIDFDGSRNESEAVNVEINTQPADYALMQNYPNPFNPITTIEYSIPENGNIRLEVYNSLGEKISTPANGFQQAGSHQVVFDGTDLSSGTYFYRIQAGSFVEIRKMLLIK